jgi:lysophospholipase L1-like esterase
MKREYIFNVILLFSALVVAVICTEFFVRMFINNGMQYDIEMWKYARDVKRVSNDPLIGHEHRPNAKAVLMGVEFDTNSKGLRDREIPYARTPGVRRILMLGDSGTVGWGVAFDETFPKRIEKAYAEKGDKVEVINTGVGNYNTIQEVEYFLTEGYKYEPDIVVLNYSFNDAEPVPHERPPGFFVRTLYSFPFIVGGMDGVLRKFFGKETWVDYYLHLYDDGKSNGWRDSRAYIRKLALYCRAHNIKLLIVSLPELHDVQDYKLQAITDLVHQAALEEGVHFADMLPYVKDQKSSALWVTPPDPHPNGYANQFYAKGVMDALQRME